MVREVSIPSNRILASIEVAIWLVTVTVAVLLVLCRVVSQDVCVSIATVLLVGIFLASWHNFDRGRHPCFLFLGLLLLFQGGRAKALAAATAFDGAPPMRSMQGFQM